MRLLVSVSVACWLLSGQTIVRIPSGTPLSCGDSTVYCVPSEYATIALANAAATHAGDIVWVSAGTYAVTVTPGTSGTSGNTLTYLANGAVTICGMTFASKSYIRVIGFTIDPSGAGCSATHAVSGTGTNTGLEFWNNSLQNTGGSKGYSFDRGLGANQCVSCIFFGGSVTNVGNPSATFAMLVSGNDTFIGYINFSTICYAGIGPSGSRLRMLNNNFSGMIACGSSHPDPFYIASDANGYSNSLIESVFDIGTPASDQNKFHHQQNESAIAWVDNVYRLNVGTNIGSGATSIYATSTGDNLRTRFYNDTWVLNDRALSGSAGCGGGRADNSTTVSVIIRNDAMQECWSSNVTTVIDTFIFGGGTGTMTLAEDYNLAYDPDGSVSFTGTWDGQAHRQSNVNPNFVDVPGLDFHLAAGSGSGANARGTGGPLTTATSCSGTTLNVAANGAANFFGDNSSNLGQYGGKLVPGDTITVGTSTTRTIVSIASDAITVDSSLTCSASDPVYFGASNTIDIGAYPYKAGGYTLTATKAQVGSTVTITPNDATLARFAVVYENGMPKCVASAGNSWACTVGSGVITAYIYPRYASQTQSVLVN